MTMVLSHTELLSIFHVFITRYRFVRSVIKSCGLQIILTFRHGHHLALRPPSPPLQGQQDVALATRMEIHEGGAQDCPRPRQYGGLDKPEDGWPMGDLDVDKEELK